MKLGRNIPHMRVRSSEGFKVICQRWRSWRLWEPLFSSENCDETCDRYSSCQRGESTLFSRSHVIVVWLLSVSGCVDRMCLRSAMLVCLKTGHCLHLYQWTLDSQCLLVTAWVMITAQQPVTQAVKLDQSQSLYVNVGFVNYNYRSHLHEFSTVPTVHVLGAVE